jgi:hypothetical protein
MWHMSDQHTWAAGRLALAEGDATQAITTLQATATAQLDTDALPGPARCSDAPSSAPTATRRSSG